MKTLSGFGSIAKDPRCKDQGTTVSFSYHELLFLYRYQYRFEGLLSVILCFFFCGNMKLDKRIIITVLFLLNTPPLLKYFCALNKGRGGGYYGIGAQIDCTRKVLKPRKSLLEIGP